MHNCTSCRAEWIASFPKEEQSRAYEAMRLMEDARQLLNDLDGRYRTHAIAGLFPANSLGDDILLTTEDGRRTLPFLRQQQGSPCLCWSDFIKPESLGETDMVGIFATSVDEGMEQAFPEDDYHHLLCQTLADRLAEATAERMHEEVRKKWWGYAPDEHLKLEELFQEKYQGKRPAVGYPSLPDQSLNFLLDDILDFSSIGIRLTESGAMHPHASTSGLLFAHPMTCHFAIGHIGDDQLQDYARRRRLPVERMRTFLTANL